MVTGADAFGNRYSHHVKRSDVVEYTRNDNFCPPPVATVCDWVRQVWLNMPQSVVLNSIVAAGFDVDPTRWFKWNHDVDGWKSSSLGAVMRQETS
ncbi:hypothetical protein F441_03814 [Phytophthora nicotianae CJ01A1]|uniref:Uncharacterized protein n=4 Tax=Phytophthora nicotianae TaxID=4792 RepID=W2LQ01_PHYNI|nr:hypothetical protein L917_03586 [Phytophthora nicotianae]ETM52731.1 hypothetical protein L914_03693 [Phytophthora nicotianae]ETP22978.1 hypothetical protein F441_03814 [Phytophthora nicotianae CJ01A1]